MIIKNKTLKMAKRELISYSSYMWMQPTLSLLYDDILKKILAFNLLEESPEMRISVVDYKPSLSNLERWLNF